MPALRFYGLECNSVSIDLLQKSKNYPPQSPLSRGEYKEQLLFLGEARIIRLPPLVKGRVGEGFFIFLQEV
jgi:hypothetical protein